MKHLIRDASQVVIAILITTSMVIVNAQTPKPSVHTAIPKPVVKTAPAQPATTPAPVQAPVTPEPTPVAETPVVEPVQAPQPSYPSSHEELMAAAGIAKGDWPAVDYIVSHESSWNQDATEPTTQAHGLVQALPFSKTGCGWEDAVCTLAWGQQYAISRYGGWWPAYDYWVAHRNW